LAHWGAVVPKTNKQTNKLYATSKKNNKIKSKSFQSKEFIIFSD